MIRYIALRNAKEKTEMGYDILACDGEGDVAEVLAKVRNVVAERLRAEVLVQKLNSTDVDPLHMEDIIEDTLYEMAL